MNLIAVGVFLLLGTTTTTPAPSTSLVLTPYILKNETAKARNLSLVDPAMFLNVTSYSGFLTVNEKYNSNLFFWYFPAATPQNASETPMIIWLQGGPGATSMAGLFVEIGPFSYDEKSGLLKYRTNSWHQKYSLLFIDNPVGAGFSFTTSPDGFVRGMNDCSEQLYTALQQFLEVFPEQRTAPLYLAGESYAGHYLPAFAQKILHPPDLKKIQVKNASINLKGLIMGNPVIDRRDMVNLTSVFYQWGLIDAQGVEAVRPLQEKYADGIRDNDINKAIEARNELLDKLQDRSSQPQTYNVLKGEISTIYDFQTFVTQPRVTDAIHAGGITFTFSNSTVHTMLVKDFLVSLTATVEELLEHYKIMVYCGQLDLTAPCVMNSDARRKTWHWSGRQAFLDAHRTPWWHGEEVAGYVKSGGNFTEVLIRNAGHLAPLDKPEEVFQLVDYFIRGLDLPMPTNYKVDREPPYPPIFVDTIVATSNKGLIASAVLNVIFVATIIIGAVYFIRWKRRTDTFFYSTVDNSSLDGVLTMN